MDIINPYIHGGEALAFDGFGNRSREYTSGDYIDIGDVLDTVWVGTTSFSIAVWVKPSSLATDQDVFSKLSLPDGRQFTFRLFSQGDIGSLIYNSGGSSNNYRTARSTLATVSASNWHHIVLKVDQSQGAQLDIFDFSIDGAQTNSKTWLAEAGVFDGMDNTPSPVQLGGFADGTFTPFTGNIADVRLYDKILSDAEVSELYAGTNITTNLVGHWLTDADNVLDAAGTNHGTNYGSKYSYDNPSPPVEFGRASRSFSSGDYIDMGDVLDTEVWTGGAGTQFTIAMWVKPSSMAADSFVFSKIALATGDRAFYFRIRTGGQIAVVVYEDVNNYRTRQSTATDTLVTADTWYHIGFTYSYDVTNPINSFYINGAASTPATYVGDNGGFAGIQNTTTPVQIGGREEGTALPFIGNIADIRVFDTDIGSTNMLDLYNGTDVQTNLVGHWLTDNDDVEDKAGTNDGTNFGSTYSYDNPPMDLVPSRQASRSFDGVNNRIDLADQTSTIGTAFSITVWAKLETLDTADGECIVDMADSAVGFQSYIARIFYYGVTGDLEFAVRDAAGNRNVVAISGFSETGWVHLAFVRNGSTVEGYVNGVSVGTDSSSTIGAHTASHYFTIGALRNSGATQGIYNTSGKICDVRLYDNVLTSTDITNIYNGTTDRTNLVGQWLTNSDDVLDHAGTNDGTNNGTTYSTDSPS